MESIIMAVEMRVPDGRCWCGFTTTITATTTKANERSKVVCLDKR